MKKKYQQKMRETTDQFTKDLAELLVKQALETLAKRKESGKKVKPVKKRGKTK